MPVWALSGTLGPQTRWRLLARFGWMVGEVLWPGYPSAMPARNDGTVLLWDLTDLNRLRGHAIERVCSIARDGLTRDEWERYIPGLPHQDTYPA